jgi:ribosome-associated protein
LDDRGKGCTFEVFNQLFSFTKTNLLQILNLTAAPSRQNAQQNALTEQINQWIIEGIRDKKGKNIVQLDLRRLDGAPTDFFIICEGDSNVHVKSISDSIQKKVKEEMFTSPLHKEGSSNARWVLMDYFNTVVHVFHPETREFYELEHLWSDAVVTEFGEV